MKEVDIRQVIPEETMDCCRDLCKVARKHGLNSMRVTLHCGFKTGYWNEVILDWDSGRHNADVNTFRVVSNFQVHGDIQEVTPSNRQSVGG